MPVVHFHNLSIPYVGQPNELFHFDKNGSYFARTGDVVVVRDSLPDSTLSDYYEENHITDRGLQYLVVPSESGPFSIFSNIQLVESLRDQVHPSQLEVFAWTSCECALVAELNLQRPLLPNHYEHYVSKSRFRSQARLLGLSIPRGYDFLDTRLGLLWGIVKLHFHGVGTIVIKQDDGVAGSGFYHSRFKKIPSTIWAVLTKPHFPHTHVAPLTSQARLVEAWVSEVEVRPSVQFFIDANGEATVISTHDQLMRKDGVTYKGCRSSHWLEEEVVKQLTKDAQKYAAHVAKEGYRGHGSLGAIKTASGNLFYTECNPRRVISSYPHHIVAQNLFPGRPTPPYAALEIKKPQWQAMTPAELLRDIAPILFTKDRGSGAIPIDCKLMRYNGTIFMLFVGETKEAVNELISQCQIGQI